MVYASDQLTPAGRRRVALRAVPPTPHYLTAEPVARLAPAAEEEGFLETIRKLWRHRGLIASCTVVLGGAAIATAWSMPSIYVSEARVQVGIQAPRLPNIESLVADISPDAERVQNEGFILQSRNIAKQVIDQLKLRDDPEFNPSLRKPSFWSRLNPRQYLPPVVDAWITELTSAKPQAADADSGERAITEDETEIGYYDESGLLLEDVVREQVLLSLPARTLCTPDCKGLCPRCGQNLNSASCNCESTAVDPRWNALAGLAGRIQS